MLWRVVYGQGRKERSAFSAGPWHPDKAHVERWAAWLKAAGQDVQVQSSGTAASQVYRGGVA